MDEDVVSIDMMFETSWEVCNKVGGIYTVLSTKAKTLQKLYKDKVIFIGPDVWTHETPSPYFVESNSLLKAWRSQVELPYGLKVRAGRWNVPGKPIAILVDFKPMYAVKNEFYGEMWNKFGVDSLHAYGDYDEACAFSHAAGIVIESLYNFLVPGSKRVVALFNEWTTGMGLLYVKSKLPEIATVFTTHATSIGRSICGNGKPLYDYMKGYNGDQMAGELNMESKHSGEKVAAHQADCFTTVSDVTAVECEQLLERDPDVVTPNGFEKNFVPAKTKLEGCRKAARKLMLNVASCLTGREFGDDAFIVATSGRCEYRNKGLDVYLDSLSALRGQTGGRDVVAFVMVPAWCAGPREDLREALSGERNAGLADSVLTHWLHNADYDAVLNRIHNLGFNAENNGNVTVIYVPCYLNGSDGIFDSTYYELLVGMDATVFPSYYEPWGYTPLESVAFGVPTITTSLSGFGQWILHTSQSGFEHSGVTVVGRNDSNYNEVVSAIARSLRFLVLSDGTEVSEMRKSAFATADKAAWKYFISYYIKAYEIAFDKCASRNLENN